VEGWGGCAMCVVCAVCVVSVCVLCVFVYAATETSPYSTPFCEPARRAKFGRERAEHRRFRVRGF
jgi:hypothetical protein